MSEVEEREEMRQQRGNCEVTSMERKRFQSEARRDDVDACRGFLRLDGAEA